MHYSVLLKESLAVLNIKEDGIYVDATLGYAGHSSEILKRVKKGWLYAFDQDIEAINYSKNKLSQISSNYTVIKSNFLNMKEELDKLGAMKIDGIIFDLGVSSPQLDEALRGFSYHKDAPLDMRMDQEQCLSAYDVINQYSEEALTKILYIYGEEKYAKSIAHNIVKQRVIKPVETTLELVDIIGRSVPEKYKREKHPAKKTFQAIRIEVNQELAILEEALRKALTLLNIDGVLCVITFHSLEDRIVKNLFKELTEINQIVKGLPNIPLNYLPHYQLITKAIKPSEAELKENNRSHSATLRGIKKIS
jgi:16S rRNA (cytosine1402-N4)-methyltransferase